MDAYPLLTVYLLLAKDPPPTLTLGRRKVFLCILLTQAPWPCQTWHTTIMTVSLY